MAAAPSIGRAHPVHAGDADLVAEDLFERFYDRVYGYCRHQLGSAEEAEDAAQLTFVHALGGLRRGVVPRFAPGWLFAIAKNICADRHHSQARRRQREVLEDPTTLERVAGTVEADGDDIAGLREALDQISEHQREAVLLREWRGLSYREIAAEMRLSVSAVETLIFRARRSLAAQLSDDLEAKHTRTRGFTLAPIAGAVKSMFAGSAAKVGLAAALAVVAVVSVGELTYATGAPERRDLPAAAAPADAVGAPMALRPASIARDKRHAPSKAAGGHEKGRATGGAKTSAPPEDVVTSVADEATASADGAPDPVDDLVAQTGDVLDPVLEPIEPVAAPVTSAVESSVPEALQLPELPASAVATAVGQP